MEFRRVGDVGDEQIVITLSSDITSQGDLFSIKGTVSLSPDYDGEGVCLTGTENWFVNPSFVLTTDKVEIFGENTNDSINLKAHPKNKLDDSSSFTEISFPSLSLLKSAGYCTDTDVNNIPNNISELADDEATAIWRFLDKISDVIDYDNYLNIVETLAEVSPSFRFELSREIESQIQQMIVGWETNAEFRIESYDDLDARIQDFENLNAIQKLPGAVNKTKVLTRALGEVSSRGSLQDVVDLCRALDLAQYHPDLIRNHQARAIMAQSLIEGDLQEAWSVAKACLKLESSHSSESFDLITDSAMDESDLPQKADLWGAAIMAASGDYETRSAISNYLYWTARTTDGHPQACAQLYEAAYHGFRRSNVTHMAQYAKYNHFAQLGYVHRQENEDSVAADQFLQAYAVASNATREFEHCQLGQCIIATRNWATAVADNCRYKGEYTMGLHVVETALRSIEIIEDNPDHRDEHSLQKLRAKRRVLEMEQYLTQAEYELALETAGNIIGIYAKLGKEDSQNWAITKRKEIQAIVYETNGDLERAAGLHREIGETGSITDKGRHWHIHRGDICETKQLALNGEYEEAKSQLLEIKSRTNRLESEANDLAIVLDAVIGYQKGEQYPFQASVRELSQKDDEERASPMSIEYDYGEPLSVIHAAQWLRKYNVDEEMLTMAVDVTLHASLIPLHAGEAAASIGIDEVNLRDQWVNQLPSPVAKRIKQIELDRTVPQTDYVGLGSRLFNLVELYLAIFGEYFGTRKWGDEWRSNLSDGDKTENLSLGDLANIFECCSENIPSSEEASGLVIGDGKTPSVIKLRNDISHIKTDDVDTAEFNRFYDRIMEIFRTTADDVPVIGRKVETRGQGAFQRELVQLQWWRSLRLTYIQTDAQLTDGELYYFPQQPIIETGEQGNVTIPSDEIVPVSTDRVADKF